MPPGIYGGKFIENFFTNSLDPTIDPFFYKIKDIKVSAHFVIERTGSLIQYVSAVKRAWHAGESFWNGRSDCNDYSIGIELEGSDNIEYTDIQYAKLNALIECLTEAYPIKDVVGHSDIAPKRKTDPGPSFRCSINSKSDQSKSFSPVCNSAMLQDFTPAFFMSSSLILPYGLS